MLNESRVSSKMLRSRSTCSRPKAAFHRRFLRLGGSGVWGSLSSKGSPGNDRPFSLVMLHDDFFMSPLLASHCHTQLESFILLMGYDDGRSYGQAGSSSLYEMLPVSLRAKVDGPYAFEATK
jgi:hypothetical protein